MSSQDGENDEFAPDQEMLRDFHRLSARTIMTIGYCILYYTATIPIFSFVSTFQEYKVWKTTPTPMTLYGCLKCYCFNISWMLLSMIGFLALLPMWAQRGFGATIEKESFCVMEKLIAMAVVKGFLGEVIVNGSENIPELSLDGLVQTGKDGDNTCLSAPVFVANHCSQVDAAIMYFVIRRFKWIVKESVKYLPGPGILMYLSGHVFIRRKGKNNLSKNNLFEKSNEAIQAGIPICIFPSGTRNMSKKLPFKIGAFKIAIENQSSVIPMTLHIPLGVWNDYYPLKMLWGGSLTVVNKITITIHEPIKTTKCSDMEYLRRKCHDIINNSFSFFNPDHGNNQTRNNEKEQCKKLK